MGGDVTGSWWVYLVAYCNGVLGLFFCSFSLFGVFVSVVIRSLDIYIVPINTILVTRYKSTPYYPT